MHSIRHVDHNLCMYVCIFEGQPHRCHRNKIRELEKSTHHYIRNGKSIPQKPTVIMAMVQLHDFVQSIKMFPVLEQYVFKTFQMVLLADQSNLKVCSQFRFSNKIHLNIATIVKLFNSFSLFLIHQIVDGSQAGSGNLEILVNGGRVTSSVRALGAQRFIASFTPHEPGVHTVQITFNAETVPGKSKTKRFQCKCSISL